MYANENLKKLFIFKLKINLKNFEKQIGLQHWQLMINLMVHLQYIFYNTSTLLLGQNDAYRMNQLCHEYVWLWT